jgi:hypothetical protein
LLPPCPSINFNAGRLAQYLTGTDGFLQQETDGGAYFGFVILLSHGLWKIVIAGFAVMNKRSNRNFLQECRHENVFKAVSLLPERRLPRVSSRETR